MAQVFLFFGEKYQKNCSIKSSNLVLNNPKRCFDIEIISQRNDYGSQPYKSLKIYKFKLNIHVGILEISSSRNAS